MSKKEFDELREKIKAQMKEIEELKREVRMLDDRTSGDILIGGAHR